MNKNSAMAWIVKAWHNLSGAELFYKANHYTDVTAVELHYAVEKLLKSFLAYENKKIPKTHKLEDIYDSITKFINLEDDLDLLELISTYHIEESYPAFEKNMPSNSEIKEVLNFTNKLFEDVCKILNIDKQKIINE